MHCRAWLVRYLRDATVAVMESTELWCGDDCAESVFDGSSLGHVAFEAHVTAGLVVERVDRLRAIAKF